MPELEASTDSGSECVNKTDIGDRLADRLGLNKAAAKDAVDGVFEGHTAVLSRASPGRLLQVAREPRLSLDRDNGRHGYLRLGVQPIAIR